MTTIFQRGDELVIGLNTKVLFVYPEDLQIFKILELPENFQAAGLPTKSVTIVEDEKASSPSSTSLKSEKAKPNIENVVISPNGQLIAVTTSGEKAVLIYGSRPEMAIFRSIRPLTRAPSCCAFNNASTLLAVLDKSGDCWLYDCSINLKLPPKLIFGHLSIVYDVLWSLDDNYIITCDRDDKIRVTKFPKTEEIHGYCLGHREFVSAVKHLKGQTIVSISGDKTLRVWNYESCIELADYDLPGAGIQMSQRKITDNCYQIAVLLQDAETMTIGIYNLGESATDRWVIREVALLNVSAELYPFNLCYGCDNSEQIYVTGTVDNKFRLEVIAIDSTKKPIVPPSWLDMIHEQFKDDNWHLEDIGMRYKKQYDNLSEYHERKRKRAEEKSLKNA